MNKEELNNALAEVMGGILVKAEQERKLSKPYIDLFKSADGTNFISLLGKTELRMTEAVLDTISVIKATIGKEVNDDAFALLMALPYIALTLTKDISLNEGHSCCVDKVYYLLDRLLKEKMGIADGSND